MEDFYPIARKRGISSDLEDSSDEFKKKEYLKLLQSDCQIAKLHYNDWE